MADQKDLKRRLKVLMQKPENQICSDCPERQPRWASLIVPPPGSPPGSLAIGAFCCLECSGSHRRLGVHISFVRSVNLDSWKEKEVLAMENGGNKKVNAIWEANLARAGGQKPTTGADLNTRERYIREKYERRRFYDPQALLNYQNSEPSVDELVTRNRGANEPADFADFGPPSDSQISDAAKLRAEKKKKKTLARGKSFETPARSKSGGSTGRKLKRQDSEPQPVIDLLDLGVDIGPPPASNNNAQAGAGFADFFGADMNGAAPAPAADVSRQARSAEPSIPRRRGSRSRSKTRTEMRTKSKTPDRERTRKAQQQDILNMYSAPLAAGPMAVGGMPMAPNNSNNMAMNNQAMMAMMQQMQQMSMNPQQQMQMQQPGFGGAHDASAADRHNSRLQMHQNLMMQNTPQQRMMQPQGTNPNMMQQPVGGMMMNPNMMNANMMNPQMMQAMMSANLNNNNMTGGGRGMPNGMMGMNPNMMGMNQNMMMGMNPMMMQQTQMQMNQFGGMPMGGVATQNAKAAAGKAPEKEDPFAQFGMNAFR